VRRALKPEESESVSVAPSTRNCINKRHLLLQENDTNCLVHAPSISVEVDALLCQLASHLAAALLLHDQQDRMMSAEQEPAQLCNTLADQVRRRLPAGSRMPAGPCVVPAVSPGLSVPVEVLT
jgi:hypothetical protein